MHTILTVDLSQCEVARLDDVKISKADSNAKHKQIQGLMKELATNPLLTDQVQATHTGELTFADQWLSPAVSTTDQTSGYRVC